MHSFTRLHYFQIWLSYSPIADYTGTFYDIGATKVNWLSLVYPIATIPFGFVAIWILDEFGIRQGVGYFFS